MKKFVVFSMIAGMLVFGSNSLFASAIGGKVIYNKMMDEYSDREFENNISGGIFFDMGNVLLKSMRFRPGFDWVTLETEDVEAFTAYSLHFDWYWFFTKARSFSPFIGFGPALNYYNYDDDEADGDSDAGIEGFGGFEFNFSGSWSLLVEIRLVQHDVAYLDARILKGCIGIVYYF